MASDILIRANHIERTREQMYKLYEKHTGQKRDEIERALDRDKWMTPEEAKEWGHIDEIVENRSKEGDD